MQVRNASRRIGVPVAALVLLAAAGVDRGPEPDVAAIAEAAGHPARLHLRARAAFTRDGLPLRITLDVAGTRRLERTCAADVCSGTWFDGSRQRSFGPNGTPYADRGSDDPAERTYAAIASTSFAEPGFVAAGGSLRRLPAAGDERRFAVRAPGGAELVAVTAPGGARLTRVDRPDDSLFRRLVITGGDGALLYAERGFDEVRRVDDPLDAPAGPAVSIGATQGLAALSARLPIVPCSLAGRRANCLIDTGTTPSAVTLDFAEELGLEPHGRIEIAGLDSYLTGIVEAGPLAIGPATFAQLSFAVIPHLRAAGIDVILGSDALAALRISFANGGERVEIAAPRPPSDEPANLEFAGGVPFAQVRLGAQPQSDAMLVDTGDGDALSIGYDRYRRAPDLFTARGAGTASGAGAATMDSVQGILARAEIAGTPLGPLPIDAVRGQRDGHLGYGMRAFCRPFVVDLGRARLECGARSDETAAPSGESKM